jgi:cytochrome c5
MRSAGWLAILVYGWCGGGQAQAQAPAAAAAGGARPLAPDDAVLAAFPPSPGRDVVVRACVPCHAPELVVAKRRTEDEWDRIIAAMIDRGAVADEDEQQRILEYLLELFGPAPEAASSRD